MHELVIGLFINRYEFGLNGDVMHVGQHQLMYMFTYIFYKIVLIIWQIVYSNVSPSEIFIELN